MARECPLIPWLTAISPAGDTQAADEHFTARRIGRIAERRRVIFDSKPSQGKREAAPRKKKKKEFFKRKLNG